MVAPADGGKPESHDEGWNDASAFGSEVWTFDEAAYRTRNPPLAGLVRKGAMKSGLEHFIKRGRIEGRDARPLGADLAADEIDPATAGARLFMRHNDSQYLAPVDLSVTELRPRRIAMIGSCLLGSWGLHEANPSGCAVDLITVNNGAPLPDRATIGGAPYDFQVLQISLRGLVADDAFWHLRYDDIAGHEAILAAARENLQRQLDYHMTWNLEDGLLTFVANFLTPQRNPNGCLLPKFDPRNPQYVVAELNRHLESLLKGYRNTYALDLDQIAAVVGRRGLQDDALIHVSHGALLNPHTPDPKRIEPLLEVREYYRSPERGEFADMIWAELLLMYRTVRQVDSVKLVVVDLDDTLWNGVSGDMTDIDGLMVEGWPLGFAEALMLLRKRGVLIAIASKNEESRVREIWPRIFGSKLSLDDFAAVAIGWRPKTESVREMLEAMNLLPRSVVFIDDNPVERAAMLREYPDMRALGRHPYYLRRILLWSAETQVVSVTDESSRRTDMIQAQLRRETQKTSLSREAFLEAAAPVVTTFEVAEVGHPRFARCLELINKTNQFNTTGGRRTAQEVDALFRSGGRFVAFEVADAYTHYGLVGVVVIRGGAIEQWVMSCRVLGYGIEEAVMARIVEAMRRAGAEAIVASLVRTDVNFPCRDLFAKLGFTDGPEGAWTLAAGAAVEVPRHVRVVG